MGHLLYRTGLSHRYGNRSECSDHIILKILPDVVMVPVKPGAACWNYNVPADTGMGDYGSSHCNIIVFFGKQPAADYFSLPEVCPSAIYASVYCCGCSF